jgi:hypothetical protein
MKNESDLNAGDARDEFEYAERFDPGDAHESASVAGRHHPLDVFGDDVDLEVDCVTRFQ